MARDSGNSGWKALLKDGRNWLYWPNDLPKLSLVPEEQGSIEYISKKKCVEAAKIVNGPAMIEDSSLAFNAMNGAPGPYIRSFLETIGIEGLIQMIKGYTQGADMSANCICTLAYSSGPGHEPLVFQGILPVISA